MSNDSLKTKNKFKEPEKFQKIAKKYQLNFLALFGSRAEGVNRPDSDFDIAYSPKQNLTNSEEYFLERDLAKVLKNNKIDMVSTRKASPLLMKKIAYNSQLLHEATKRSFVYFQMYAFKMYVEARPLFKMTHEYVNKI
jgi:predicted nucleotidyltransferase